MNLQEIPVPLNDDLANAAPITALPFANIVDTSAASQEAGEPTPDCGVFGMTGTVWYAFTPAASDSVTAIANSPFNIAVAVYTGSSLSSLTAVSCTSAIGEPLTFHANAGTTYFFQVANFYGQSGPVQFQLGLAPAPIANASYYPPDPSTFDTVQFGDYSADPGQYGWPRFESFSWDFGDGATATEANPLHR